jgi:hypothetical protein
MDVASLFQDSDLNRFEEFLWDSVWFCWSSRNGCRFSFRLETRGERVHCFHRTSQTEQFVLKTHHDNIVDVPWGSHVLGYYFARSSAKLDPFRCYFVVHDMSYSAGMPIHSTCWSTPKVLLSLQQLFQTASLKSSMSTVTPVSHD